MTIALTEETFEQQFRNVVRPLTELVRRECGEEKAGEVVKAWREECLQWWREYLTPLLSKGYEREVQEHVMNLLGETMRWVQFYRGFMGTSESET